MNPEQLLFYQLGAALAIGLLVGIERGWQRRDVPEGGRIAGLRTFGLMGLSGGVSALLAQQWGALAFGAAFWGMAALLIGAYWVEQWRDAGKDVSITTLGAALLVFLLGALAGNGQVGVAVAAAVVVVLLLEHKPLLHRWLQALTASELQAGSKLLLVSAVVLPLLPDQGYGPWQVLNPYRMWWMVVLVAAISFVGYFALKLGGAQQGAALTGLLSGLVSSTALTLHFSRLVRQDASAAPLLAMGTLLACGTMFPRILLMVALLAPALLLPLLLPLGMMALLAYGSALAYWLVARRQRAAVQLTLQNPLELLPAILFGILLAVILLAGKTLQHWVGNAGVLVLAAASGVADVDAITLSLARLGQQGLGLETAVLGIVLAAAVNSVVKAGITLGIGGRRMALWAGLPLLLAAALGLFLAVLFPLLR